MNRNYRYNQHQNNKRDKGQNLSYWEYKEEIDLLIKENAKSKIFLKQNIQEILDVMKRPNIRIIGIEEELHLKCTENISNKKKKETCPT